MKSFLEEYGFAILAAIVVILLIAMCTPVGNMIKTQVLNMVERFAGTADKKLAAADNDEMSANIIGGTLYVQSPSKTDAYHFVIHGTIAGSPVSLTLNAAGNGLKTKTVDTDTVTDTDVKVADGFALSDTEKAVKQKDLTKIIEALDAGTTYYAEVVNDGTGYIFTSNIVNTAR